MWDYVGPITAIALAVMGIIPALSVFAGRQKLIWIATIVSVTGLSLVASFFSIQSMHADQKQLLKKNNQMIALQAQQISTLTGGDSYPYIKPTFFGDGKVRMLLVNQGRYPLYGVQVTISDNDLIWQKIKKLTPDDVSRDIDEIYDQSRGKAYVRTSGQPKFCVQNKNAGISSHPTVVAQGGDDVRMRGPISEVAD